MWKNVTLVLLSIVVLVFGVVIQQADSQVGQLQQENAALSSRLRTIAGEHTDLSLELQTTNATLSALEFDLRTAELQRDRAISARDENRDEANELRAELANLKEANPTVDDSSEEYFYFVMGWSCGGTAAALGFPKEQLTGLCAWVENFSRENDGFNKFLEYYIERQKTKSVNPGS